MLDDIVEQCIIIDLGSSTIKYGTNNSPFPQIISPNVYGRLKKPANYLFKRTNEKIFGYDALYNSPSLNLNYPMIKNNGNLLSSADFLEDIFSYIFDTLNIENRANYNILILDSIFTKGKQRALMAKILYQKFGIYQLHFEPQCIMALYANSKISGLVVNSGEIYTEIVPVYEGYVISPGINNFPISGRTLTEKYEECYKKIFDIYNFSNRYWIAQKIKEKHSEILPSFEKYKETISKNVKNEYILPDNNKIELGNGIYDIPESIFTPKLIDYDNEGLSQVVLDSINKSDIYTRKELLQNIYLCGGNTYIKGLKDRLKNEINEKSKKECNIICENGRKYSSWIGGKIISTMNNFKKNCISRIDFEDYGSKLFEYDYIFNYGKIYFHEREKLMGEYRISENKNIIFKEVVLNQ